VSRTRTSLRESRTIAVVVVAAAIFVDIIAYSIAVPVLPDLSRRYGASPTMIGLLFASFGVTLLGVSVPMGARSDRTGRRPPLVGGLIALAFASVVFAYAPGLSWLFLARLVQGAADAVTWVVGFALLADLYVEKERGRVMGFVMASASFGFMVGPTLGGWLYEAGGIRMPYLAVAAASLPPAVAFMWLRMPPIAVKDESVSMLSVVRAPAVASCVLAVVTIGGTISMFEPVFSLFLSSRLQLGPARVGLVFGATAVVSAVMHPLAGRLADRWGGRRLTIIGLTAMALLLPVPSFSWNLASAMALATILVLAFAAAITPSLTYMGEAVSSASSGSFGVAYGLYNFAWGVGLLTGPAIGGFLFERLGFRTLALVWAPFILVTTALMRWSGRMRIVESRT